MGSILELLPLLAGWDYEYYTYNDVVSKQNPVVHKIMDYGLLITAAMICDDAYATTDIIIGGKGRKKITLNASPFLFNALGATQQDPGGWVQLYFAPAFPVSSAGAFFVAITSGGFQGSPIPYVPPVEVRTYLARDSTQATANLTFNGFAVIFTDRDAFLKSYRAAIGSH